MMLLTCPDTPTGKWSERHLHAQQNLAAHGIQATIVDVPGEFTEKKGSSTGSEDTEKKLDYEATSKISGTADHEAQIGNQQMLDVARGEVIQKPTWKETRKVIFSLQTLTLAGCYFCSFGAELAINSILGSYYAVNFPYLGQTGSGKWAAMFGLLNLVTRLSGGIISDALYRATGSVWVKKMFIHVLGVTTGVFLMIIGFLNPHTPSVMFGLVAGMAVFLEAGNGANFSLVPHVHPFANGKCLYVRLLLKHILSVSDRHCLWRYRRRRKLWRHHLLHHLPLQLHELWQVDLDYRHHDHCHQSCCILDPTDTKGSDWRPLTADCFSGDSMVTL